MVLAVRENRERALGMIGVETWEEGFEGLGEGDWASRMLRVKSEPPRLVSSTDPLAMGPFSS